MADTIPLNTVLLGLGVALDTNYSDKFIGSLSRAGYDVVYVAKEGESDESWIENALRAGASIFYSKDLDVPIYLDKWGFEELIWIEEPTLPHELQEIEKRVQSYIDKSKTKNSDGSGTRGTDT